MFKANINWLHFRVLRLHVAEEMDGSASRLCDSKNELGYSLKAAHFQTSSKTRTSHPFEKTLKVENLDQKVLLLRCPKNEGS